MNINGLLMLMFHNILKSRDEAQDLSDIDKVELKKQVIEKYRELWNLLQSGNVEEFLKEINSSNSDYFKSNYYDENKQTEYIENLKKFYTSHKGAMVSMDDSELIILANGKGVALEQIGQFRGFGLLMARGALQNSLFTNYITLIKSKKRMILKFN
ncbi:hypothetical protein JJC03_02500 [Flavobacterium oreochromis]|uniref:hypothetical protein n=1 Tax=Flavobacterium oreochromis TaxID=2906078 RepID=UPI001CE58A51|nr:hypothetical protein [Flavobacterium oreochromis]QYS86895.1 hypothetical protein JJC03_02500 [Flavobacterium oreochromis]